MRTQATLLLCSALAAGCTYDASELGLVPNSDQLLELAAQSQHALTDEDVAMPGVIDEINNPRNIDPDFTMNLAALPTKASLATEPWSDSYWPEDHGGISYRWQRRESFGRLLAQDEIGQMDPVDISKLSPAEKYDLFAGSHEWGLTQRAIAETSPNEPGWAGYCHGWAPASLQFPEPQPVTVFNDDGVEIRFGSSDIKALLTYFSGQVIPTTYSTDVLSFGVAPRGIGSMCGHGRADLPSCYDANPGALHVVLGNQIGLRGKGFVLEVDPTYEKWNQPVFAYDSEQLGRRAPSPGAAEGAVEEVIVATTVSWGQEIEPLWEPVVGTHQQVTTDRRYLYTLELDGNGDVIGGQWLVRTQGGQFVTMSAAWNVLMEWDANGDGQPDMTRDEASVQLFQWFPIPDFAWVQDEAVLPTEFEPIYSYWELVGGSLTTRRNLHGYFGRLHELL